MESPRIKTGICGELTLSCQRSDASETNHKTTENFTLNFKYNFEQIMNLFQTRRYCVLVGLQHIQSTELCNEQGNLSRRLSSIFCGKYQ